MSNAGHSQQPLSRRIQGLLAAEPSGDLVVAFSGGLDSTVLLHCLAMQPLNGRALRAVHIHHGLLGEADAWATHCANVCVKLDVPFECIDVQVEGIADVGLEAAARTARYAALRSNLRPGECLLTAHHQQDQAETVLLQLMRGGGAAGLAAMPFSTTMAAGRLLRPLLEESRASLREYAEFHQLQWVEDPSNQDADLERALMRHKVLPVLREHWPQLDKVLARSAAHFAETAEILADMGEQDLSSCSVCSDILSVPSLLELSEARRRNLLRYWLRKQGEQAPSSAQLRQMERDMLLASEDAEPLFQLVNVELRRYRDQLYCLGKLPAPPNGDSLAWSLGEAEDAMLTLPSGCGSLRATQQNSSANRLPAGKYTVSFIQGGERIQPTGDAHHRRLKQLLQQGAVPPWVRRRMPLLYHGHRLVAVADRWVSAELQMTGPEQGFGLQWLDAPRGWQAIDHSS